MSLCYGTAEIQVAAGAEGYNNRYRNGWGASIAVVRAAVEEQRRNKRGTGTPISQMAAPLPLSRFAWPVSAVCRPSSRVLSFISAQPMHRHPGATDGGAAAAALLRLARRGGRRPSPASKAGCACSLTLSQNTAGGASHAYLLDSVKFPYLILIPTVQGRGGGRAASRCGRCQPCLRPSMHKACLNPIAAQPSGSAWGQDSANPWCGRYLLFVCPPISICVAILQLPPAVHTDRHEWQQLRRCRHLEWLHHSEWRSTPAL